MAPRNSSKSAQPKASTPAAKAPKAAKPVVPAKLAAKPAPKAAVKPKAPVKVETKAAAKTQRELLPQRKPAAPVKPLPAKAEVKVSPKPQSKPTPKPTSKPAARTKPTASPAPEASKPAPKSNDPVAKPSPATSKAKAQAQAMAAKPASQPAPACVFPEPSLTPEATKVLRAIHMGHAVELVFQNADANPPRTFEPRQLLFDVFTQAWFVWGWDRRYNAERHHRLDQMAEVNVVEGPGRSAQGPYPDGTPANQIGGWRGGEPIPVKATLLKQWIFAVKQAPAPFPDFLIEDAEEGKALVSFTGTDLRAIARWCMQFGDGLQVLEPQRLVDRIKQVGIAWGGKPVAAPAPRPEPKQEPRQEPKSEARHEHRKSERSERSDRSDRSEHRKAERPEARPESRRPEESPREESKGKASKVEVRFERL